MSRLIAPQPIQIHCYREKRVLILVIHSVLVIHMTPAYE